MSEVVTFHDLPEKSVFVTGGGSGIGAALTEELLAQGANVAFVQRSDASEFVASMKEKFGRAPLFLRCDITDPDALEAALTRAKSAFGPVQVLINNAANDTRHDLQALDVDGWDRAMNVNLRPHFITARAVAPDMQAAGDGSIINFSSISYLKGMAGYPAYVTAKAAIVGLTRALARELGPDGIRVNAVVPGWVLTKRQLDLWATKEALAEHMKLQCLKEHLEPRDVVDAVLFLASEASRMMTSQAMIVDGGVAVSG